MCSLDVLAAGKAIGLVGEWKGAVDYLKTSYNANRLGQVSPTSFLSITSGRSLMFSKPLIAAVMNACILCEKNDQAISLYDELIDTNHVANEWQWSGGQDRLHPLCRDLALRALGYADIGMSDRALAMMKTILDDGAKITVPALYGVLLACEKDGRWVDAIHIAMLPFDLEKQSLLARNEEQLLSASDGGNSPFENGNGSLKLFLLPVIRVCVAQGLPGAAVLSQILFATYLEDYTNSDMSPGNDRRGIVGIFARLIAMSPDNQELLTVSMVSLCCIESFAEACTLFEEARPALISTCSEEVYNWALSQKNERSVKSDEWKILFERIRRIAVVSQMARNDHLNLSVEDLRLMSVATATCMRSSVIISEPEVGLILSKWIESVLSSKHASKQNYSGDVKSLPITDSYLAAAIAVAAASGNHDLAYQLAEITLQDSLTKNETTWTLSCNETLRLLFGSGKTREALEFFRDVSNNGNRNPETFEIVATGLANNKEWSGVSELYGLALSSGFNSEDLSIVAMKAVADGPDAGNVRLLRIVVEEIASQMRKKPLEWLGSKYWILKESLGFPLVRRLMRWDNQNSARSKELEFLIIMFESRVSKGIAPEAQTLSSIVSGVIDISHEDIDAPGKPRNAEQWNALLERVAQEAERTTVFTNRDFVSDMALAFWKLGNHKKCADWVGDALSRGIQVRPDVLDLARSSDEEVNMKHYDLEMMMLPGASVKR